MYHMDINLKKNVSLVGSEVPTVVAINSTVFSDLTSWSAVEVH
jgi:hypothetical protein